MKRFSFFLALALIVASFGLASAGSISLETTSGTWVDSLSNTKIIPGGPVVFDFRVTNDNGVNANGMTNGFTIYGPSSFDPIDVVVIDPNFSNSGFFDLVFSVNYFSNTGSDADTVGIGGSKLTGSGLPAGYDDVAYSVTTGNIPAGETLCIDSAYYPPTGSWLWAPGGAPDWDGPHCFLSEVPPCLPPTVNNAPVSLGGSHCDPIQFDFNADDGSEDFLTMTWSADVGMIDANGVWTYSPTLADVGASISVTVTATQQCDGEATVNLIFTNEAPVLTCPASLDVSAGIATDLQLSASDDCDGISYSVTAGPATIDANTGLLTITAPAGVNVVTVEVTDGNASSTCDIEVTGVVGSLFQVEIPCFGAPEGPVFQGQHVEIPINLVTGNAIDGFDLLIGYDNSALSFQFATEGGDLTDDGWEYFNYRYGANGNCSNACPSGLLRIVGIAETNNGPVHPVIDGVMELALLDFLVTNDRTMECQSIPIRFYWMDCGDNTLSTDLGNNLHVSQIVYDGDEVLFPPNGSEIQDFNYGFPTYFGTQNECIVQVGDKPVPIRDVSFNNGCVFIACADAIDARGDINLNYISNEIADAVLYSNYFVYGLGVFTINTEGQIAASDVNADGLALSVADLVYLVRIIIGDALPYPKLAAINTTVVNDNGTLNVAGDMGAAFVVYEGNVNVELLANGMEFKSAFDGVNTRALIYSIDGNTFSGDFINSNGNIVSVELASIEGAQVTFGKIIPANFELAQNYPNPFNPTTTLGFSVPFASQASLVIYNVTGQKVAEFNGSYEAGIHTIEWDASAMASGIYFYKLNAGDFSDTKKMVLLK